MWQWGSGWLIADEIGTVHYNDGDNPAIEKYMDLGLYDANRNPIIPLRIDHYEVIYDGKPITRANRNLLAAAPELLAALVISRGQWIHSVNAQQCLDAIAKAEGKEPEKTPARATQEG